MTTDDRMKAEADHENELRDVQEHTEDSRCVITPLLMLPPDAALAVVSALTEVVAMGHHDEQVTPTPEGEIRRAQTFEEGEVYMSSPPYEGYFADRYIMDFYDVKTRDICSRMHLHTGLRFVRMMTGPDTTIRVSSLSPFEFNPSPAWPVPPWEDALTTFVDDNPDGTDRAPRRRYNAVVPPNAWVDMQVPRGVSHQFNAVGPNAIIDSVHPEESIETLREGMSGYKMMAQTIFLARELPPAATCTAAQGEPGD